MIIEVLKVFVEAVRLAEAMRVNVEGRKSAFRGSESGYRGRKKDYRGLTFSRHNKQNAKFFS
jgi:hypothetical protein